MSVASGLWILFAYLLGSFPTGYVAVRLVRGEDIRRHGSSNIGATNVGRVLGRKWAIAVAVCDMSKGGVAILLAMACGVMDERLLALVGAIAVLGHDYPVWLGFKGGKGVATTFGAFACFDFLNPFPALTGGIFWYLLMKGTGYVSVASLVSLGASVLLMPVFGMHRAYWLAGIFLFLLAVWRHRTNLSRLIAGDETRVKGAWFARGEKGNGP